MTYKFVSLGESGGEEYQYGNVFAHEVYPDWSRVTIGANEHQVRLMLEIARQWAGPFGILYVLVSPRLGHEAARYQSAQPCSYDDLELFAYTFEEYFEQDSRHHLWVIDIRTNSRLVYDDHDHIYSYGNDDEVVSLLKAKGFSEGNVQIPIPHQHRYNPEHDDSEDEIMEYWEWIASPLEEHDDR
jgi:hypothetical protein